MSLFNRHEHQWKEAGRIFQSPITNLKKANGDQQYMDQILYGVTLINFACECGRRAQDKLLGKVES